MVLWTCCRPFLSCGNNRKIGLHLTHLDQRAAFLLQIRSCDYHRPNIRIFWYLIHNIQHKFFQDGPCLLYTSLRDPEQFPCVDYVSNDYAIFYTPLNEALPVSLERYPYYSIPGLFTLLDLSLIHICISYVTKVYHAIAGNV